jgi:hypothetical protein
MRFQSAKTFALVGGLALGTVVALCAATDADTTVGDCSGALQEVCSNCTTPKRSPGKSSRDRRHIVDIGAERAARHQRAGTADGSTHFTKVDAITGAIDNRSVILGPYGDAARNAGSLYLRLAHKLAGSLGQLVVRQDPYSQSYFYYSNFAGSVNVPPNELPT